MDVTNLGSELVLESVEMECSQPSLQTLHELELCLIAGGMGDVLQ